MLDKNEIEGIISSFQKHWLNKTDIQQILDTIGQTYKQRGYANQPIKISFQIKKDCLNIEVEEK